MTWVVFLSFLRGLYGRGNMLASSYSYIWFHISRSSSLYQSSSSFHYGSKVNFVYWNIIVDRKYASDANFFYVEVQERDKNVVYRNIPVMPTFQCRVGVETKSVYTARTLEAPF